MESQIDAVLFVVFISVACFAYTRYNRKEMYPDRAQGNQIAKTYSALTNLYLSTIRIKMAIFQNLVIQRQILRLILILPLSHACILVAEQGVDMRLYFGRICGVSGYALAPLRTVRAWQNTVEIRLYCSHLR